MKLETIEKLKELIEVNTQVEWYQKQYKELDSNYAQTRAKIIADLEPLITKRKAILEVVKADPNDVAEISALFGIKKRAPRKTTDPIKQEEKAEGAETKPAKKRGAKDAPA